MKDACMGKEKRIRITVLGTRGSVPVSGRAFSVFGGNTSCYLVEAGGESILLDAGSGIVRAPITFGRTPKILLSHLHVDHLLGLGMYGRLSVPGAPTELYIPALDGGDAWEAIGRLFSPPLWPLRLDDYPGDLRVRDMPRTMRFGGVTVESAAGSHPGGSQLIKITFAGKTLVYATDFEHGEEASARLAAFARDADLLLYDGQYTDDDYEARRGFGHSTASAGMAVMERANVGRLLVVHHDPHATDQELIARERALKDANVCYAREGEVIEL